MGVEWVSMIPSMVFTRIKNEFPESLKKKYKMSGGNFSTVGSIDTPAVFPFVYVQVLPAVERGQDLEGTSINAGLFTVQIDVTDNKSQVRAKEVAFAVMATMKSMGFEVTAMPSFENTKVTHRSTARYRRLIGANDVL